MVRNETTGMTPNRLSAVSIVELGQNQSHPERNTYTVTSRNESMRNRRHLFRERTIFAFTAITFIVCVSAIYLFFTLQTQGVFTLDKSPLRTQPNSEPSLSHYGVGFYDLKESYGQFESYRSPSRNSSIIEPSQLQDQSHVHYVRIVQALRDLDDFLSSTLKSELPQDVIVAQALRYTRSLELNADRLAEDTVRKSKVTLEKLKSKLWNALEKLQEPEDCSQVSAIHCHLVNPNGFSACIHDVLHCVVAGLQLNRTVILNTRDWPYTKDIRWDEVFKPLTKCSTAKHILEGYPQQWDVERKHLIKLPASIASDLLAAHGEPYAWFYGILMSYILRPSTSLSSELLAKQHASPYVGIHIRRTDKKSEAQYHGVDGYMKHAEEYYERVSLRDKVDVKRVYVATDDTAVTDELQRSYRTFTFESNAIGTKQASKVSSRSRGTALKNIFIDIWHLSRSDFLVCTMSSGFCRVAYELMQAHHTDSWRRFASLDSDFHYAYAFFPERILVEPANDLVFKDEVGHYRSTGDLGYYDAQRYHMYPGRKGHHRFGMVVTHDMKYLQTRFKTTIPLMTMEYENGL